MNKEGASKINKYIRCLSEGVFATLMLVLIHALCSLIMYSTTYPILQFGWFDSFYMPFKILLVSLLLFFLYKMVITILSVNSFWVVKNFIFIPFFLPLLLVDDFEKWRMNKINKK